MESSYFATPPGYLKVAALCASIAGLISFLFLLYGWAFMVFGTLMMGLCNSTLLIVYHATGKLTPMDGFYESAFSMLMAVLLLASAVLIGISLTWTSAGIATTLFCSIGSVIYFLEAVFAYQSAVSTRQALIQRNLPNTPLNPHNVNVYMSTNTGGYQSGVVSSPVVVTA